jgi:hypothetical protein
MGPFIREILSPSALTSLNDSSILHFMSLVNLHFIRGLAGVCLVSFLFICGGSSFLKVLVKHLLVSNFNVIAGVEFPFLVWVGLLLNFL